MLPCMSGSYKEKFFSVYGKYLSDTINNLAEIITKGYTYDTRRNPS